MGWWGKLLGGAFGFVTLGGPLGALLGAAIGHGLDQGIERAAGARPAARERVQAAFFTATFGVLGHLAKADGRVTRDELAVASALMERMRLDAAQRRLAQDLFREGKRPDFRFLDAVDQLREECRGHPGLIRTFLEVLVSAACIDGEINAPERRVLEQVRTRLGLSARQFASIEMLVRIQQGLHGAWSGARNAAPQRAAHLEEAYSILGVDASASEAEIKRAYRRLMSQHHPDKLVARGLPEEMMDIATEKAKELSTAYERIREARGF